MVHLSSQSPTPSSQSPVPDAAENPAAARENPACFRGHRRSGCENASKTTNSGSALRLRFLAATPMSCHVMHERAGSVAPPLRLRARPLRVALVGQPNVGKSVVFGRLTGRYVTVSNYPGTTVAVTTGRSLVGAEVCDVIDTPGVNSLEGAISEDEKVTRNLMRDGGAELIVQIADARNLRRALM